MRQESREPGQCASPMYSQCCKLYRMAECARSIKLMSECCNVQRGRPCPRLNTADVIESARAARFAGRIVFTYVTSSSTHDFRCVPSHLDRRIRHGHSKEVLRHMQRCECILLIMLRVSHFRRIMKHACALHRHQTLRQRRLQLEPRTRRLDREI